MSIHRTKKLFWWTGHAVWAGVLGAIVLVLLAPPAEVLPPRAPAGVARKTSVATPMLPSPEELQRVWSRPLRQPLFDPPPAAPVVVKTTPPPLPAKLLGTIEESGQSKALFAMKGGSMEIRGVGEKLGEDASAAEIVSIEQERVVVKYHGQSITLTLEASP